WTLVAPSQSAGEAVARFREEHKEQLRIWRALELDWPLAMGAIERLAEYWTDGVLCDGQPLLHLCLLNALAKYKQARAERDDVRLRVFLQALMRTLGGVPQIQIEGDGTTWSDAG